MLVRLHDRDLGAAAHHLAAADRGGQVERGGREVGELGLDRGALGAARGVVEVRLVDRSRGCGDRVHARDAVRQQRPEPTRPAPQRTVTPRVVEVDPNRVVTPRDSTR